MDKQLNLIRTGLADCRDKISLAFQTLDHLEHQLWQLYQNIGVARRKLDKGDTP